MIKVDLDLGQSGVQRIGRRLTMKAIERMLKIERLFSNDE
jgi:hypothetical protein